MDIVEVKRWNVLIKIHSCPSTVQLVLVKINGLHESGQYRGILDEVRLLIIIWFIAIVVTWLLR